MQELFSKLWFGDADRCIVYLCCSGSLFKDFLQPITILVAFSPITRWRIRYSFILAKVAFDAKFDLV